MAEAGFRMSKADERIITSEVEEIVEEEDHELGFIRRNVKIRYILAVMGFFGFGILNVLRVSMSLAIVAMVDWRYVPETPVNFTCIYTKHIRTSREDGPFKWEPYIQGHILACYFYGLIITQFVGKLFAEKISAKYILLCGTILASLAFILIPATATQTRAFAYTVMIFQLLKGLGQGFIIPAFSVLMGKWIPKSERYESMCLIGGGIPLGGFFGLALSGVICKPGGLGWQYVFYIFASIGFVWCVLWIILIYESPLTHPYITHRELIRILESHQILPMKPTTPYRYILKSPPVWAYIFVGFASFWALSIYLTVIPLFMSTILKFDIEMNGVVSSLPHLAETFVFILSCLLIDRVKKRIQNHTRLHKISISIGLFCFAGCMIAITLSVCKRVLTVTFLTVGLAVCGLSFASISVIPMEMAPQNSGTISAMMNTLGATSGIIIPTMMGYIINEKRTMKQWNILFYCSAVISIFAGIFFIVFGSCTLRKWDDPAYHAAETQEPQIVLQVDETPGERKDTRTRQPSKEEPKLMVLKDK